MRPYRLTCSGVIALHGIGVALGLMGAVQISHASQIELLVSDNILNDIQRYDVATGQYLGNLVDGFQYGFDFPDGMALGPDDLLYISYLDLSDNAPTIARFDPWTGAYVDKFDASGQLTNRGDLLFGPDGYLYVTDHDVAAIQRFQFGQPDSLETYGTLGNPVWKMVFAPDGSLLAGECGVNNAILQLDPGTGELFDAIVDPDIQTPYGLAFGPNDLLYIATGHGDTIVRYDWQAGASLGVLVDCYYPHDLQFGPYGYLYAVHGSTVRKLDPDTGEFLDWMAAEPDIPYDMLFIPEPATGFLVGVAGAFALARRRRER